MSTPKLRFKEFDGDWSLQHLGSLFSKRRGKGISGIPTYSVTLNNGIVNRDDLERDTPTNLSPQEHLLVKKNDLAYNMMRMWQGALGRAPTDGIVSPAYVVLKPIEEKTNSSFFEYYFKRNRQIHNFWAYSQGLTEDRLRLYFDDFKVIKIDAPSKEEQTKIASFLSAVDEKINQLTQKYELLSQYKQGMMQKLFSQQIRFKADDGSKFGEWEKVKFVEKFNFHNTNSYSRALLSEQGEIMNIHYGDIHTKFSMLFDVTKENVPFLGDDINIEKISQNQFLQIGDLVIADASEDYKDIGKAIEVINLDSQRIVAGLHTYIARPNTSFALGFCGYLMQTFQVREQIKKLATGISVLGISKTNISKVEINVPCLEEQTKIANFLSAIDQKIEVVAQQIEQAKTWKKGLLQQMFV